MVYVLLLDDKCNIKINIIDPMKGKKLLNEEQKRKKGLIKTPANKLNSHFNYYYLFSTLDNPNEVPVPKNRKDKEEKKK